MSTEELPPPTSSLGGFITALIIVLAAASLVVLVMQPETARHQRQPGAGLIGTPMPELLVEGWINGPGPTNEELKGKIVLIDAWAYWCGPCRKRAPELIKLHDDWSGKGVVFIGLTSEPADKLTLSEKFVSTVGFTWPQGYGAVSPLQKLEAYFIPQHWIIDQTGHIVWDATSEEQPEDVLSRLTGG